MPAKTVIALFSSDAHPLYKADVYRALALPNGYVLQFRYERKYIHNSLLSDLRGLKGQPGQIIFVSGNDLSVPPPHRSLDFHPVRLVTVKDIYEDPNINTIHFYLEMADFSDAPHLAGTPSDQLPPGVFVSRISLQDSPDKSWIDRVKAIETHFNEPMFFHVAGVRHKGKVIQPVYSAHERSSRYPLNEEDVYELEIAFYDPKGGQSGLIVENTSEDVVLNVPSTHKVGAERDTTTFELHTHTLSRQRQIAYTHMEQQGGTAGNRVQLQWAVTRGPWKPLQFGLFSVLAALGVMGAKVATDDLEKLKLTWANSGIGAVSLLCVGGAAGALYWLFNKK